VSGVQRRAIILRQTIQYKPPLEAVTGDHVQQNNRRPQDLQWPRPPRMFFFQVHHGKGNADLVMPDF